jgi:hypothetical protein
MLFSVAPVALRKRKHAPPPISFNHTGCDEKRVKKRSAAVSKTSRSSSNVSTGLLFTCAANRTCCDWPFGHRRALPQVESLILTRFLTRTPKMESCRRGKPL